MTKELERRILREPVAVRAASDGGPARIGGYALKFNKLSRNLGGFVEQIDPSALRKSEADGWPGVMARYNHELLLGSIAGGSLRLTVDGTGLDYEVDLLDDHDSQRVNKLVGRGDVSRSSFAAYMHESDWSQTQDGFPLRTVTAMIKGTQPGPEASVRKILADEHGQRIMELAVDMAGPGGLIAGVGPLGSPAGLWNFGFLFSPALTVGGGTGDVQRNIVAEKVLGLPHDVDVKKGMTWAESRRAARGAAR